MATLTGFRVMAVDDEPAIRAFVARVLTRPNHAVTIAVDGADALDQARRHGPFDLLVTDLMMPGMRGDELARRLRQQWPDLKVLYFTGFSQQLFEQRAQLWHDEAFLEKPASLQGLREAVSLLLEGCVPAPRPVRVRIPGARVRVGDCVTTLEVLSVTGGRVVVGTKCVEGHVCPVVIDVGGVTLRLIARVISCELRAAESSTADGVPAFVVAFAFTDVSVPERRLLEQLVESASPSA
jgi:CheY-like chemotaxis protein